MTWVDWFRQHNWNAKWKNSAGAIVLIAVGGFFGANARYGIELLYPGLPSTFMANVTGSFLLGIIVYESIYTGRLSEQSRLLISTGFLSSYTTYSTFAYETVAVEPLLGLVNVTATYAFGFIGVVAGRWIALQIRGGSYD